MVQSVRILTPPENAPKGWDAADALAEGWTSERVKEWINTQISKPQYRFQITDWHASRYSGAAPERRWLVENVIPLGSAGIIAAMGDTGKGLLTLDLAIKVASGPVDGGILDEVPRAFGSEIRNHGSSVIFTAEDDEGEVHRRLEQLDVDHKRDNGLNLYVVSLPNAGGPIPLVAMGRDGPIITEHYLAIRDQLMKIPDIRLIVFDPLAAFVYLDINADPQAGAFTSGLFAHLASETGASVAVCHHMTKGHSKAPIETADMARDAIRGTSAIVDEMRWAYALWPERESVGRFACQKLEMDWNRSKVFCGALVKSNAPGDKTIRTFVRSNSGLLVDRTQELEARKAHRKDMVEMVAQRIGEAAAAGRPYTKTGANGVWTRREEFPKEIRDMSKSALEDLVQALLDDRRIVKCSAKGSHEVKWMDVQGGPFANGVGEFASGAER